jgi:preprotein translocase subunit SecY
VGVLCVHTEYASTLHNVLVGLESSSLALWKLVALAVGYLGLLLFTVYLASSEVRLPIVQYAKGPPLVRTSAIASGLPCRVSSFQ